MEEKSITFISPDCAIDFYKTQRVLFFLINYAHIDQEEFKYVFDERKSMLNLIFVIEDFLYFLNEHSGLHPGLTPSCNLLSLKQMQLSKKYSPIKRQCLLRLSYFSTKANSSWQLQVAGSRISCDESVVRMRGGPAAHNPDTVPPHQSPHLA